MAESSNELIHRRDVYKRQVLCNQDFLTQHLMKLRRGQDGLINAAADLLVVDEAHNLDDKVRSALSLIHIL